MAFKKYPLVLVDWVDPWSKGGWSENPHELNDVWKHDFSCQSVGWIVKEDSEKIMLAASRTANDSEIGDLFLIPRRVINAINVLNPAVPLKPTTKTSSIKKQQ